MNLNEVVELSTNDKLLLVQHAITKYETENILIEKLNKILSSKDTSRTIDTLIGTQKVRRIGTDVLQNNVSHTGELPNLPERLKPILDSL